MAGSKIIAGSQPKLRHLILYFLVSVLPPICCHIGWGLSYLCIFVEEVVTLLGVITDKLVLSVVRNDQVKGEAKNINAKCFACELWVKRVGTFGVVLYRNQ